MTRREVEDELLQMGRVMREIVSKYAPNANMVSVDVVKGTIRVSACEWDSENQDYIERDILRAFEFTDGVRITEETA